jgi:ectoine hydroxylase-related dioxygenase (phytanoyl-CoA dioxygenase family)
MNDLHGTTALWPGSHRGTKEEPNGASVEPRVPEGSCLLWDYRLWHGGTANRSSAPRPLLYATYCRSWFVDHHNFSGQAPLSVAPDADLSPELVRLLARERASGQSVG